MKIKRSAHALSHPGTVLVECGDGWGCSEHMTSTQARAAGRALLRAANSLDRDRNLTQSKIDAISNSPGGA